MTMPAGDPETARGVDAAVRVADRCGLADADPVVLGETNNVVVWLRPHPVVARVGRWPHSVERLRREHSVATALARSDAPIAPPFAGARPITDAPTGYVVTLWERLDGTADAVDPIELGRSLRALHEHLASYDGDLPDFRHDVRLARRALDDDRATAALADEDRALLRRAIDTLVPRIAADAVAARPLHGEPHGANLLATPAGPRWIDLEDVCRGPVEWDLAFLPDESAAAFDDVDREVLSLMRVLNSARTATWCWVRVDVGDMRWHAEHHVAIVRAAMAG